MAGDRVRAAEAVRVEESFQIVAPQIARINKTSKIARYVLNLLGLSCLTSFLIFGIKLPLRTTIFDGHHRSAHMATLNSQSNSELFIVRSN
jgi:hypothetical protein